MKDEIKEILFLLHNDRLTESGKRKLSDYITNLEKENKELLKKSYSDDVIITIAIKKINDLIEVETKETDYDRFYGDNDYTIKKLNDIKNILKGGDSSD